MWFRFFIVAGLLLAGLLPVPALAHPSHQHSVAVAEEGSDAGDAEVKFSDFVYLSMIEPAAGGRPASSVSRLVTASGRLQYSEERNDGTLLKLRVVDLKGSALLDQGMQLVIPRIEEPPGSPELEPMVDFLPSLAFLAQGVGGELRVFESFERGLVGADYRRFIEVFDRAIDSKQAEDCEPGLYFQAVPYLGNAEPEFPLASVPGVTERMVSRPFQYHYLGDQESRLPAGKASVRPNRPILVSTTSRTSMIAAYRLDRIDKPTGK